ncbi:MAG TPA: hypothetical protein VGG72_22660 [Bryobacteraceae bacterium]
MRSARLGLWGGILQVAFRWRGAWPLAANGSVPGRFVQCDAPAARLSDASNRRMRKTARPVVGKVALTPADQVELLRVRSVLDRSKSPCRPNACPTGLETVDVAYAFEGDSPSKPHPIPSSSYGQGQAFALLWVWR